MMSTNTEVERIQIDVDTANAMKNLKAFRKSFASSIDTKGIAKEAKNAAKAVSKSINGMTKAVAKPIKNVAALVKSSMKKVKNSIIKSLKECVKIAKNLGLKFGKTFVKAVTTTITKGIKGLMKVFKTLTLTLMKSMASVIKGSSNLIGASFRGISKVVTNSLKGIMNNAKKILSGLSKMLDEAISERKMELEIDADVNSRRGGSSGKQKSSGGSGMASALLNAGMISSSLKTITSAIAKNNIGGLNGDIAAKFASKMIDAGEKTLAFGSFVYKAYRLFKQYWPNILDAFGKISEKVSPILKRGFNLVTEAVGKLLSKGMTIVVNKIVEIPNRIFPLVKNGVMKLINSVGTIFQNGIDMMLNSNNPKIRALGVLIKFVTDLLQSLAPVLMSVVDGLVDFADIIIDLINEMDFSSIAKTIGGVLGQLVTSIRNVASYFAPYLSNTVKALVEVFGKAGNLIISVIKNIEKVADILSPLGSIVAPLIEAFGNLIDIGTIFGMSFSDLLDRLSPSLRSFVDTVSSHLVSDITNVSNKFKDIAQRLPNILDIFNQALTPPIEKLLTAFSGLVNKLYDARNKITGFIKEGFSNAGVDLSLENSFKVLSDVCVTVINGFTVLTEALTAFTNDLVNIMGTYLSPVITDVVKGFKWTFEKVTTFTKEFISAMNDNSNNLRKAFRGLIDSIMGFGYNVWNGLKEVAKHFINVFGLTSDNIGKAGNKLAAFIGNTLVATFDILKEAVKGASYLVETTVVPVLKFFVDILKWVYDRIKTFVKSFMGSFDVDFKGMIGSFVTYVESLVKCVKAIITAIGKVLNALGVTQVIDFLLKNLGKGIAKLVNFISKLFVGIHDLEGFIFDVLTPIVEFLGEVLSWLAGCIKEFFVSIPGMIKAFVDGVKDFIDKLKEKFPLLGSVIDGFVKVVKAVTWPFRKAIEVVTSWFGKLLDGIKKFFFWLRKERKEKFDSHVTEDQKLKLEKAKETKGSVNINESFRDLYGIDISAMLSDNVMAALKKAYETDSFEKYYDEIGKQYKKLEQHGEIAEGLLDEAGRYYNELGQGLYQIISNFVIDSTDEMFEAFDSNADALDFAREEAKNIAKYGKSLLENEDLLSAMREKANAKMAVSYQKTLDGLRKTLDGKDHMKMVEEYKRIFGGADLYQVLDGIKTDGAEKVLEEVRQELEKIYEDAPTAKERAELVNDAMDITVGALKKLNEAVTKYNIDRIPTSKDAEFQANYFEERMRIGIDTFLNPLTKSKITDYMSNPTDANKQAAKDAIKSRKLDFNSIAISDMSANTFLVVIQKYLNAIEKSANARDIARNINKEAQKLNAELDRISSGTDIVNKTVEEVKGVVGGTADKAKGLANEFNKANNAAGNTSGLDERQKTLQDMLETAKRVNKETSSSKIDFDPKDFEEIDFDNLKLPKEIQDTINNFSSIEVGFDENSVKGLQETLDAIKNAAEKSTEDITIPDFEIGTAPKSGGTGTDYKPEQYKPNQQFKGFEELDLESIKSSLDNGLEKIVLDTVKDFEVDLSDAPEVTFKKFESTVYERVSQAVNSLDNSVNAGIQNALKSGNANELIGSAINNVFSSVQPEIENATKEMADTISENIDVNSILSSIKENLTKEISSSPVEFINVTSTQDPIQKNSESFKPSSKFSDYAKSLTENMKNSFNTTPIEKATENVSQMADTMEQQTAPAIEQVKVEFGNVNKITERVKRSASKLFTHKDYKGMMDGLIGDLEKTEEQAKQTGGKVEQIFNETEFSNLSNPLEQTSDALEEIKIDLSGIDDGFDEAAQSASRLTEQTQQATEQVAEQDSFAKFFADIKNGFKSTLDAVDAYVDMGEEFEKVLHPVRALKKELSTQVTSSLLKTTTQQVKDVKDEFGKFRKQVESFKNSDLKGFDKLKAKLQLMGQHAKIQMKQFKLIFKTNAISKLIKRMQGPVEKETKELAEKSPGGKENIGLFQGGLKKLALLFGGIGIGSIIKTSTEEAIGFESAMMLLNARLGESVSILNDFANTRGLQLGLSKANIAEFGNIFSVYVSQFAKDTEEMASTTKDLLEAAAITAQSTGYTMQEVMESFRSGLTGSVESLDQYGINIKVAALESSAAFKEIANGAQSWDQLTQAQQQQLISMNIVSQVHRNFGNGVRNTNALLLQFQAALANVRLALGNTFKVIAAAVLPPLTMLMQALEVVLNKVTQFVTALLGLFGIEVSFEGLSGSGAGAGGGLSDLGDSVGDIADSGSGVGDTADSIGDVGDAASDAAEKASELTKELYGIDEINKIQLKNDSGSGSGSGGSGSDGAGSGAGGLGDALAGGLNNAVAQFSSNNELEKALSEKASRIAEILKTIADAFMLGWNKNLPYIQLSLDRLKESFEHLRESGKTLFRDIWDNGGSEFVTNLGALSSAIVGTAIDLTSEWIDTIADVFDHINPVTNPAMQYFLESLNTFIENVEGLLLSLGDHFRSFKDNGGRDFINNLADIALAIDGLLFDLGGQVIKVIDNFFDHLDPSNNPKTKKMISSFNYLAQEVEEFILSIGGWFDTFWQNGGQAFVNNLGDIIVSLGDLGAHIAGDIIDKITDFMNSWVGEKLIEAVATALETASEVIEDIVTFLADHPGVVETFLAAWATYKAATTVVEWANGIALFCSEAKALVTMLGGDLVAKLTGFFGAFKGAGFLSGLKGMFAGIGGWISGALGSVWGAISGVFSAITGAIGTALTAIAGFFGVSVGWVVAAIVAIIAAVVLIWKNWDKICEWCKKAWKALCKWVPKMWDKVCDKLSEIVDNIVKFFEDAWEAIKEAWSEAEKWAKEVKEKIVNAFKDFASKMAKKFTEAWNKAKDVFNDAKTWATKVKDNVIAGWDAFKSNLGDVCQKAWTFAKSKFDDAKTWATGVKDKVIAGWDAFKSNLGDVCQKAWTFAKEKFNDAKTWATGVKDKVIAGWDAFKSNLGDVAKKAWDYAKEKFNDALTWATGVKDKVVSGWNAFKDNLGNKASEAWNFAKSKFNDALTWATGIKDNVVAGWNAFKDNLTSKFSSAWSNAKSKFNDALTWATGVKDNIVSGWNTFKDNLTSKFSSAWSNAKSKFNDALTWAQGVVNNIGSGISGLSGKITGYFSTAWSNAKGKFNNVLGWAQGIRNNIGSGFSGLSDKITGYFSTAWSNAKAKFSDVSGWAQGIANTIKNKFSSIGSGVASAIGSGLKSTINSVLSRVETMINSARTMINKIPGVNISYVRLPRLAKGGITTGPTIAEIGERGREAVLPLENNTGWMDSLADKLATKMDKGNNKHNNVPAQYQAPNITINIGGNKFGEIAAEEINKAQRRAGRVLLDL